MVRNVQKRVWKGLAAAMVAMLALTGCGGAAQQAQPL